MLTHVSVKFLMAILTVVACAAGGLHDKVVSAAEPKTAALFSLTEWFFWCPADETPDRITDIGEKTESAGGGYPPPDPDFSPQGNYSGPLLLPDIVRFDALPMRMHLEPAFPAAEWQSFVEEHMVQLWERMLKEGEDSELLEVAALSLARVADLKLADIRSAADALVSLAAQSQNARIRYACAAALASGDIRTAAAELIRLAAEGTDSQRLRIEPALARWKVREAAELWAPRITDPDTTTTSFQLAAEGLSSTGHSESAMDLIGVAVNRSHRWSVRTAAARSAAILNPGAAAEAAEGLISRTPQDRLVALMLMDSPDERAIRASTALCSDPSDAVAAAAWLQVFRHHPQSLQDQLTIGLSHRDAFVRMTAARVVRLFPDAGRITALDQLKSDIHIQVRNVARQMLVAIAEEHSDFHEQIVGLAALALDPQSSNWQGIEQALLILGQLQATTFAEPALSLVSYPRDEVGVTAAWLLQLAPDESLRDGVRSLIEQIEKSLKDNSAAGDAAGRQAMLLQYAGLVRMHEIQPLLESQFAKSAPGTAEKRASALWALSLLFEKNPDPNIARRFEERIQDRLSMPPEFLPVRRASVLALGIMRAEQSHEVVRETMVMDPQDSLIPDTARWALPLLGQPFPPELSPLRILFGGWRITPADSP